MKGSEKNQKITYTKTFTMDAVIVYSPEKELEVLSNLAQSQKELDWKPAIILSVAYLEKYCTQKLIRYFKKKNHSTKLTEEKTIQIKKRFGSQSLPNLAVLLYGLDLIDAKRYTQISQLWRERIRIIHPKKELPAYIGKEANKKYKKMVNNAREIIKLLKKEKRI